MTSLSNETSEGFFHALRGDDGVMITTMRASDGYINATKMCQSGGKQWKDYHKNARTEAVVSQLSHDIGVPSIDLIRTTTSGPNHLRGTWIHHRLAIHLAQWVSPLFAVKITELVDRYVRGEITTAESRAVAVDVAAVIAAAEDSTEIIVSEPSREVAEYRLEPQFRLQSAGSRNPSDLLRPHIYFGTCGPELLVVDEQTGRHLVSGITVIPNDEGDPPPYDVVRLGHTENIDANPQRKRAHDAAFGGPFDILDWVACSQPGVIEQRVFNFLEQCNRRIVAKAPKKTYNDQSTFRPLSQEEYNFIVETTVMWAREHEDFLKGADSSLLIEREKTAQERLRLERDQVKVTQERMKLERDQTVDREVLLEREKTRQLELRLQFAQLGVVEDVVAAASTEEATEAQLVEWIETNTVADVNGRLHQTVLFKDFRRAFPRTAFVNSQNLWIMRPRCWVLSK